MSEKPYSGFTALVIDDELPLRKVIIRALSQQGFRVIDASNGLEGLQKARAEHPHLIISDINMEKVDGYEAVERLRSDPETADIPIILMTGLANHDGMRRGMALGADDYLPKPFSVQELLSAVGARLQHYKNVRQKAENQLAEFRTNLSLALPHEFLTPLNGILGFAELLRSQDQFPVKETQEIADSIFVSGQRLHRLIQNFLIYTQIESLRRDPKAIAALPKESASGLLEAVTLWVRGMKSAADRLADIAIDMQESEVLVSPDHLRKIFEELLGNALKFSPPGSRIAVQGTAQPQSYQVRITDSGRGFNREYISRIGAYAQFDRDKNEQQGMGLGLAIAKGLAEIHGGKCVVDSEPGRGTTVTFSLPLA
jgi:two-component system sensor histidine kinase/response regulator